MNGKAEWIWRVVILAGSALVAYFTATGTVREDVAVLKAQYSAQAQDIRDIKQDVRAILERVYASRP